MTSVKVKTLAVVFALLLFTGIATSGCKEKPREKGWVNTDSMPGKTFTKYHNNNKRSNSKIVYLGSNSSSSSSNFGPNEVSFDFKDLK